MMDTTLKALIDGLASALADDDLDLSGVPHISNLRDVLQQQRAQLLIGESLQHTGRSNQLRQARPVRPHHGPGLLLGSMWKDYAHIDEAWGNRVKVATLRMFAERVTMNWLKS